MLRTDDAGRRTMDARRQTPDDGHWTQDPKPHTISSQLS